MFRICFLFLLSVCSCLLWGQGGWQNSIYATDIRTLQVIANEDYDNPPLIGLQSNETISISFDELSSEVSWISYRIVHCDASWKPSRISELEYLDGFNQNPVENGQPSFNTFVPYYHYQLTLPNDKIRFTRSGNYAVLFYKDDQPDVTIACACFSVYERNLEVSAEVTNNTDISFKGEYQQVSVRLKWRNSILANPADELQIVVSQNNRRDNEVIITHPTRFSSFEAVYEHNRNLIFEAGNNYRRFEIVSPKYAGIGVEKIRFFDPMYHVLLSPSIPRKNIPYYYDQDQNGRYIIRNSEAEAESDTEADYFMVHFALEDDNPFIQGSIYLDGDFTNNRFADENKMVYNFETRRYEKMILLKQGHYNYQYLFLPNGQGKATSALIEGNFYETGNEYLIKVYHRPPGQRYDRLIGVSRLRY